MIDISIIVPVYKVKEYLSTCIESLIEQSISNIEIILVDDGSPDCSGEICEYYASKDKRIKVIHKENGGLMSAWKSGVTIAEGKYIGFVDGDDWIDKEMFEVLFFTAEKYNTDITCCEYIREYKDKQIENKLKVGGGLYTRVQIDKDIYPKLINDGTLLGRGISPNRVTKLFLASIVKNNLKYCNDDISFGEDMHLTFSAICDAEKIYIIEKFYPYHYRMNMNSITGSYISNYLNKIKLLNINIRKIAEEKKVFDFDKQLKRDLLSLTYGGIKNELKNNDNSNYLKFIEIKRILNDININSIASSKNLDIKDIKFGLIKFLIKYKFSLLLIIIVFVNERIKNR